MVKQIIAAGDDILSDALISYYILAQSQSERPKVCLLPTASGDNVDVIRSFYSIFSRYNAELDYLPLFHNKESNIKNFILNQDIIVVTGGHTKSMLGVWKEWDIDKYLKEAYDRGIVLAGGSAGSVCWFDECITDSFAGKLAPMSALGFLPFSNCPHYRSEERRAVYKKHILEETIKPGYAISDGAAIHFKDDKYFKSISSNEKSSSFYVSVDSRGKTNKITSERLPSSWLGDEAVQEELILPAPAFKYVREYKAAKRQQGD